MATLKTMLLAGATALVVSGASWYGLQHYAPSAGSRSVLPALPVSYQRDAAGYGALVSRISSSVVTVEVEQQEPALAMSDTNDLTPFGELFRRFFGDQGPGLSQGLPGPQKASGLGSGFIVDAQGDIVTNNHVVADASKIKVMLEDGRELPARLVGADPGTDLAVIHVDGLSSPALTLANSDTVRVGDAVLALGNPFGLGQTATTGIISARGRALGDGPYVDYLQTDAAINRGNSGGPLINASGQVVGVNTAIYSPNGGSVGVGFAIPSNTVRQISEQLIKSGSVTRGYLGVTVQPVTPEIADALGLPDAEGALVANVKSDGPSAGKLLPGDVILAFAGHPIKDSRDLPRLTASIGQGKQAKLDVLREGVHRTVAVELGVLDLGPPKQTVERVASHDRLGATVALLDSDTRQQLNVPASVDGVVITSIKPGGSAAEAGLKAGDVIERIGRRGAASPADVRAGLKDSKSDTALLLIYREGQESFVAVPLGHP